MSTQGDNVIIAIMGAGLVILLMGGFVLFRAPVAAVLAPVPLVLLCFGAVRKDLRHVRRHGWNVDGDSDGPEDERRRPGPDEPGPQGPSGGGEQSDWETFVTQFWDHVDRRPVASE